MRLGLGIQINCIAVNQTQANSYEFDSRFWNIISMRWETINDTWEEEI